jgi:hypothetical protein
VSKRRLTVAALALSATVLAGCGSSARHDRAPRQVTVPAYDAYPPDTISVSAPTPDSPACRRDARGFALASLSFLAHSGPESAYPADLYYMVMREEIADFGVRGCSPELLGSALERGLTAGQRRTLVADLPRRMADTLRQALSAAGA